MIGLLNFILYFADKERKNSLNGKDIIFQVKYELCKDKQKKWD